MTLPALPRGPVINAATGGMMPQWLQFFDSLRRAVSTGDTDTATNLEGIQDDIAELNAAVAELQADTDPDAELEARLALLEGDYLFSGSTASAGGTALSALEAQITGLATDLAAALTETLAASDGAALYRRLEQRLLRLETETANAPDATGRLVRLERRLAHLDVLHALSEPQDVMALRTLRKRVADLETEAAFE